MTHAEIREKYNCKSNAELTKTYRNNKEEPLEKFEKRVTEGFKNIEEKYARKEVLLGCAGQNVLLVSH
jgi:broad specificity phosphatase PhoE